MSDQKLIDWLKKDFENFKVEMKSDVKDIKKDLKSMLQFKWQIMGGTVVASLVIGTILHILIAMFGK